MSLAQRFVGPVDRFQQKHGVVGFAVAVNKKFGNDNGGSLAALLTYYGFLSLLPLLLVLVTVLGLIAGGSSSLTHRVETSALSQFPVVGNKLGANIHELHNRSAVGLVVGIVVLIWGSQGVVQSGQYAMAEVWNVPTVARPGYVARLKRTFATLATVGVFLLVSTALAGVLTTGSRSVSAVVGGVIVSLVLNAGLFLVAFRLLTPGRLLWRQLAPGAVVGGIGWTVLQFVGTALVEHSLKNSSQVYGFFAIVLGLLAWISLGARLVIYAAEINVVKDRHLWPRSLQPSLTPADRRVLVDISMEGKQHVDQGVSVRFEPGEEAASSPPGSTEVSHHPADGGPPPADAEPAATP